MRKILLLVFLLVCVFTSQAQFVEEKDKIASIQLVNANKGKLGLSSDEISNLMVHTAYQVHNSDIRMAYMQQTHKGIPVYNQVLVLAFRNGTMVSNAGEILRSIDDRTSSHSGMPSISAIDALQTALTDRKVKMSSIPAAPVKTDNGSKLNFGKMGLAKENITAELLWFPAENTKEVKLIWQIFVAPNTSSDYWLVRVDATANQVISTYNLTVYCNWDKEGHSIEEHVSNKHFNPANLENYVIQKDEKTNKWQYRPFVVNNATYRVIRYPAESPIHPGGTPQTHTNPWTWAPGNATTLGWHTSDNSNFYDSTRGNNVFAYEDRDNNNLPGFSGLSTTAQPDLTFDFVPDFTQAPTLRTPPNQQFNTTNLFYWNNLIHDITYLYGFTESARNFQTNNLGRGGVGNDHVFAEAQDGSGTNNANFASPPDGNSGRMQMYLWTTATPQRDGDVDNGIIMHEYAHGISNRMTGTGSGCLNTTEQMGEGWSDYYTLMLTHNWATATPGQGFSQPRGVGTYALAQPITGVGIRPTQYTTNMAINPSTYGNLSAVAVPHGVGYLWCTALWDMTWEIIQQAGISPNLFDPTATGGNVIALKLVQEGLRLQPCGPGFITGRNAILRADTLFYGAQYSCAILRAFARRGMGLGASQGSANVRGDEVLSFNGGGPGLTLTASQIQALELQNITYTNIVTANCDPINNWTLTDTLPTHATWVSGGSYNPLNRVVSFSPVTVPTNTSQTFQFTVNVNAGSYFTPSNRIDENVDAVVAPVLPAAWTAATSNATAFWRSSAASVRSGPNAFFVNDIVTTSDVTLRTAAALVPLGSSEGYNILSFWHRFVTESGFDGGVVEVSTNGGGSWTDLQPFIIQNGYTGNITGGRRGFTGNSGAAFIQTRINMSSFSGQNIMIRFRFLSDISVGSTGWFVDDITLNNLPVVFMKSHLYNGSNVLQATATNSVEIINVCTAPAITTQPQPNTLCTGSNALFSVAATGNGLMYQWELSTDGGGSWNPIPGAVAATYTITGPTSALNGRLYRCVINGTCGTVTSNAALLYVSPPLTHSGVTVNPTTVCVPAPSTISGTAGGGSAGGTFGNYTHTLTGPGTIVANPSTGPNNETGSFTVTNAPVGVNNYIFTSRDGLNCPVTTTVTLTTSAPPVITTQPVARVICQGASTTFSLVASGLNLTYQWQLSINIGASWNNIPGATTNSTAVTAAALSQSGYQYRCIITSGCGTITSNAVTLTVTPNPLHTALTAAPNPVCEPGPANLSGTAVGGTLLGGADVVIATSGVINLAIADLGTVTNNLTVPAFSFAAAANLKVRLNIAHTWVGDLIIRITNPCGNTFVFDRPGVPAGAVGNASDLNGVYLFDLGAATIIPESGSPAVIPAGSYRPSDVNGNPHSWTGLSFPCPAAGVWTISIQDNAGGDVGTLSDWAILGPSAVGQYTHSMTGPFTIVQNPASGGASNPTANFTVSNLGPGVLTYNLTSIDSRGCSVTSPITVNVVPRPSSVITPAAVSICNGSSTVLTVLDTTTIRTSAVPITIPSSGPGTPYPGTLAVSGLPNAAQVRSVILNGLSHTFSADIDILLRSPNGTNVILMSDVGGGNALNNVTYTFRDGSPALGTGINPSGTYRPTNTAGPDNFPAPGPGNITQVGPTLASFNTSTLTPNGTWNLFVVDDLGGDLGSITSWSIIFNIPGAQTITYTWSPATGLSSTTGNPVTASPTVNTTYSVSAVSSFGCTSSGQGTALVTVLALPAITAQPLPATQTICPGYNVTYSVTATGAGLTYQWRKNNVNLVNGGSVSGVTTATLLLTAVTAADAGSYDVVVSGSCPPAVTSNVAVLQIGTLPTITTQPPATAAVCERYTRTIAVVATALPPVQIYQWQISTDNGANYTNMANSTVAGSSPFYTNVFSATLTIANAPLSINGYRYRCVITTNCGFTITSGATTLTVNPTPTVTATPVSGKVCISDTLVLLSGTPAGGVWSGAGVYNGNQFLPYRTAVGTFPIKYKVTNSSGCADSATINIKVEECPERIRLLSDDGVLLYPNPNNGQFNIRVNSVLYNYLGMKVFSSHGALVKQQKWSNLPYGRVLPIDIRHLAAGIYMVYVFYEDGVRTSEKTFKVIVPAH